MDQPWEDGLASTLQEQRDVYEQKIVEARKLLAFNETNKVRFFRQEGSGPEVDITEDINNDHRTLIESYTMLVKVIDDLIAQGR